MKNKQTAMEEYFEYAERQGTTFTDNFKRYYLEKEKAQLEKAYHEGQQSKYVGGQYPNSTNNSKDYNEIY